MNKNSCQCWHAPQRQSFWSLVVWVGGWCDDPETFWHFIILSWEHLKYFCVQECDMHAWQPMYLLLFPFCGLPVHAWRRLHLSVSPATCQMLDRVVSSGKKVISVQRVALSEHLHAFNGLLGGLPALPFSTFFRTCMCAGGFMMDLQTVPTCLLSFLVRVFNRPHTQIYKFTCVLGQ